uniref:CUB domain-containing protein n=1 Tax=Macrostomum lignano TaxID=282301 RepID=A0A1I8G967_9PLAT
VRLACPLLAKTAGSAATCFEDCQRSPKAATVPELQTAARCELRRRQVAAPGSSMGDYGWSEVTIEYEFSDFSQRYDGNYTCKFMLLRAVSTVKVALPATESSKTSAAYATTPEPKNSKIYDSSDSAAVDVVRKSSTAAVSNSATGIAKKARPTEAPLGDWFRMESYGPITLGHVIAVSLSVVTLLLVACLAAGLVSCYCRRIRRKRRRAEFTISMDGTGGWGASLPRGRQTPIGGFSTADIAAAAAASVSASATLQAGADSSWTSSPIYADVESSPLISGGGSAGHRQNAAFGSQGRGINGA